MFKKNTREDEIRYANLISSYTKNLYTQREIMEAARAKANAYGENLLYILRVWESKAYGGNFNLDRERY